MRQHVLVQSTVCLAANRAVISAAACLKNTYTELAQDCEHARPGVTVALNFASAHLRRCDPPQAVSEELEGEWRRRLKRRKGVSAPPSRRLTASKLGSKTLSTFESDSRTARRGEV